MEDFAGEAGRCAGVPAERDTLQRVRAEGSTADDIRFTANGKSLNVFVMGWPGKEPSIAGFGTVSKQQPGKVHNVEVLGHKGKLKWTQDAAALKVELPAGKPCDYAVAWKVALG